jgi:iron complex outermembrane receptor protein
LRARCSNAKTSRAFQRGPVVAAADWSARNSRRGIGIFAQVDYTLPTETTISGGVRCNHEKIGVAFDNNLGSPRPTPAWPETRCAAAPTATAW